IPSNSPARAAPIASISRSSRVARLWMSVEVPLGPELSWYRATTVCSDTAALLDVKRESKPMFLPRVRLYPQPLRLYCARQRYVRLMAEQRAAALVGLLAEPE